MNNELEHAACVACNSYLIVLKNTSKYVTTKNVKEKDMSNTKKLLKLQNSEIGRGAPLVEIGRTGPFDEVQGRQTALGRGRQKEIRVRGQRN